MMSSIFIGTKVHFIPHSNIYIYIYIYIYIALTVSQMNSCRYLMPGALMLYYIISMA